MTRWVVGLSGGVDSSVAAALLVEGGHEVIGVTLRTAPWQLPEDAAERFGACCSPAGARAARAVARRLGIPYYLLNHEAAFERHVIADFVREYRAGRTPSPCVVCNRAIKFGTLLERAQAWEADGVATGHYARVVLDAGTERWLLLRGSDPAKDQSYFLWPLTQAQLARACFPVGHLTKAQVRERARALGLPTAEAPESQELCFVGADYREFLRRRVPEAWRPGPILDPEGRRLGTHGGLAAFTVGQRRGLGLGGGPPRYVLRLDPARNAVVVGPADALAVRTLRAAQVNLIAVPRLAAGRRLQARARHRAPLAWGWLEPVGPGEVEFRFEEPQRAITPGQSVVFYEGDVVVGGGVIADAA